MPYVSSIVPKLVPAVAIVMPSSDGTRNPTQCDFFQQNKICPSILKKTHSGIPGYSYSLINSLFCSQCKLLTICAIIMHNESIF